MTSQHSRVIAIRLIFCEYKKVDANNMTFLNKTLNNFESFCKYHLGSTKYENNQLKRGNVAEVFISVKKIL